MVRAFRKGDDTTPIVLMGYYNPIYIYGVDAFPRRREGGRRRRADRRRPAARGGRGAVPAGAQGRPQLHPARDADHRRQAPAGGAREHVGLRLLRLDHRHHRRGGARRRQGRARRWRASSATPSCRSRSASACAPRSRRARSRRAPTAWWSARRWSTRCKDSLDKKGKATARTVKAVTGLVAELADGVRGASAALPNSYAVHGRA